MTSFIIIALLITAITLGLLVWPLRKNRNSLSYARQAQNIHYAKERIQELDDQLQNASISATDYEALKLEIENTLADDIDIAKTSVSNDETVANSPKSNKIIISLLCTIIPIGALGFYYFVGTPDSFALAKQTSAPKSVPDANSINEMLAAAEQRLKEQPNESEGWNVLAKTYFQLGRYDDAKRSMLNLMRIEGESAALLTSIADVTSLSAGNKLFGEPLDYIERALKIDPDYPQALWMAGMAALQTEDAPTAVKHWERLLPLLNDSPQEQQELRQVIEETRAKMASGPIETKPQIDVPEAESTDIITNKDSEEPAPSDGIKVSVSIDPAMLEKTKPSDLVFVFAKATKGPPAPLAVKRLTVADLPATINLSDNDAMLAQFKLSLFENVSISARVAKAGNPIAQAGDIESSSVDVKNTTTEEVKVIISAEIK